MKRTPLFPLPDKKTLAILFLFALLRLSFLFFTSQHYGYFRDELYYLATSEHLDWGYVDHPPFEAFILAAVRRVLGDSLFALRLVPALTGAAIVFLAGLMAYELGGSRFAQCVAALSTLIMPCFLGSQTFYSMNVFDQFFWAFSLYLVILQMKNESFARWIILGFMLGFGLMNKISVLFLGFGLFVGILATPYRRWLLQRGVWLAGGIAGIMFLPYVVWQFQHDWATTEFMHNASTYKNYPLSPLQFMQGQMLEMHPFPVWLAGLYFLFIAKAGRTWRLLGWIYLSILIVFILQKAKVYYFAPIYPMMFAAGGVIIEAWLARFSLRGIRSTILVLLAASGLYIAPLAAPILPVETVIRYIQWMNLAPPPSERNELRGLPQHFADMFGWEEMVQTIADAWQALPPEERSKCAILVTNYGEAGAIDFFGKRYPLPKAICPHNNYYFWGPGETTGEVVLTLYGRDTLMQLFDEVTAVGLFTHPYCMAYENNRTIYLCRKPKIPLSEAWPRLKHFM